MIPDLAFIPLYLRSKTQLLNMIRKHSYVYIKYCRVYQVMLNNKEVTLLGSHVILRPPRSDNLEDLKNAAKDGEIWKNPYAFFPHVEEMSIYL
jgi:hypothetical protein